MSIVYKFEHYSPFVGELMGAINDDVKITPVLEQAISDTSLSPVMTDFWFSDKLTTQEESYLKDLVDSFTYTLTNEEPISDTYSEVISSGTWYNISNSFVRNGSNLQVSLTNSPPAMASGEITAISITASTSNTNFFVQVIKNARPGGGGAWGGGVQVGQDFEKPVGEKSTIYTSVMGADFEKGDHLSIYIKRGSVAGGVATSPLIRLFVRYN